MNIRHRVWTNEEPTKKKEFSDSRKFWYHWTVSSQIEFAVIFNLFSVHCLALVSVILRMYVNIRKSWTDTNCLYKHPNEHKSCFWLFNWDRNVGPSKQIVKSRGERIPFKINHKGRHANITDKRFWKICNKACLRLVFKRKSITF